MRLPRYSEPIEPKMICTEDAAAAIRVMRAKRGTDAQRANKLESGSDYRVLIERMNAVLQEERRVRQAKLASMKRCESKEAEKPMRSNEEEIQYYQKILSGDISDALPCTQMSAHTPKAHDASLEKSSHIGAPSRVAWIGSSDDGGDDNDSWLDSDAEDELTHFVEGSDMMLQRLSDDDNSEPECWPVVPGLEKTSPDLIQKRAIDCGEPQSEAYPVFKETIFTTSAKKLVPQTVPIRGAESLPSDFSDSEDDSSPSTAPMIATSPITHDDLNDGGSYLSDDGQCDNDVHELGLAAKAPPMRRRPPREYDKKQVAMPANDSQNLPAGSPVTRQRRHPRHPLLDKLQQTEFSEDQRHRTRQGSFCREQQHQNEGTSKQSPAVARRLSRNTKKSSGLLRASDFRILDITPGQRLRVRPSRRRTTPSGTIGGAATQHGSLS